MKIDPFSGRFLKLLNEVAENVWLSCVSGQFTNKSATKTVRIQITKSHLVEFSS